MINVIYNNWSPNFNPFYVLNHQFSRLLSLLDNDFISTPECLSLTSWLPLNIFLHGEYAVFWHSRAPQPSSLLLLDMLSLIHILTLIHPTHSCQSTFLECHCLVCHPANFHCEVLMLWPVPSFPSSALWDMEPIHLCSPATYSSTNACAPHPWHDCHFSCFFFFYVSFPILLPSWTPPLSTWLPINCYVTLQLGSLPWSHSKGS